MLKYFGINDKFSQRLPWSRLYLYTILGKKAGNRIFAYRMSHIDSDWDVWGPNFDKVG